MSELQLDIQNLEHSYSGSGDEILHIPRLSIKKGESVFLHGPSGCGKSTLLGLVAGTLSPKSGKICLQQAEMTCLSKRKRDKFRADQIGCIFQQFNLLPYLNALDNVMLGCQFSRLRRNRISSVTAEAQRLLTALDLPNSLWHSKVSQLSLGQQQRVAAARALIGIPSLILADEPTSALDQKNADTFLELLFRECKQHDIALLMVSHDLRMKDKFDRSLAFAELTGGVL